MKRLILITNILYKIFSKLTVAHGHLILFSNKEVSCRYSNLNVLSEELKKKFGHIRVAYQGRRILYLIINTINVARSKYIYVDESNDIISKLHLQRNRHIIVYIGHGGGSFKKMGWAKARSLGRLSTYEQRRLSRINGKYTYVVCSSDRVKRDFSENFNLSLDKVIALGLPRIDLLYKENVEKNREIFFSRYPEASGKKIILYAPTYRNDKDGRYFPELPNKLKGLKNCFLCYRAHPTVQAKREEGWVDVSAFDQNFILSIVDILITDYSSILFDFSYFSRPIIYYNQDKLQLPTWNSPENIFGKKNMVDSEGELLGCIEKEEFIDNSRKIWDYHMSECDGFSANRIANFIENLNNE